MDSGGLPRAGADGIAVPERRAPSRPTPGFPLEVAQVARRHLKLQNTIHWVKSIAIDREAAGASSRSRSRRGRRSLQADQQRAVRERLPRIHLSLLARRAEPAGPARRRRAVSGRVEHQAVGEGRRADSDAAATRGSSPTRRSRAATATGRTRRHSRRRSRNSAFACTA